MKHLKRYINLAINKELFELHKYPFRKYKIKYQESKRTHLTPEELGRLENLKLDGQRTLRPVSGYDFYLVATRDYVSQT